MLLAALLSLFVLKFDWDASLGVGYEFVVLRELGTLVMIFMFPGSLVAIGSYAHAAKRRAWGRLVLIAGCLATIGSLFFLFAILPFAFARISTWSMLNLSFVLLAILTLIFSLLPGRN